MTEAQVTAQPTTSPQDKRALQPIAQIKSGLDQMRGQLLLQLPSHVKVDRFMRICVTAVNNNPDLIGADRRSFFNACLKAASDGLMPDGREGALVIFKDDRSNKKLVQWMPMVTGLLKLIRQSGEIDSVGARIVYKHEIDDKRFSFVIQDGVEKLFHDPLLWGDRGPPVLAYSYARFKESGIVQYLAMHRADIMKRKAMSRAAKGPWQSWEEEMWLKTVLRALAKRLPLSSDILDKIEREEEPSEFDKMRDEAIATASAQLGAPPPDDPPLIETGGMEDDPPLHDEPPQEEDERPQSDAEIITSNMVDAACAALEVVDGESQEGNTLDDLDSFADHMRSNIRQQPLDEPVKEELLRRFNTAVLARMRSLPKGR